MIKTSLNFLFLLTVVITSSLHANEIDIEKNDSLFTKMFGNEYQKVLSSSSKSDDEKYAQELITNAAALSSNPELQSYIRLKAAELFFGCDKERTLTRDILLEISPNLPKSMQKDMYLNLFELQKKILTASPRSNKDLYAEEVETYLTVAQLTSNNYLSESNFSDSIKNLKEAYRYVSIVDRDAAKELSKQIQSIQKESYRFNQISNQIDLLQKNPTDNKANLSVAEYYLLERNNFYMASPYLENTEEEAYRSFFNNFKICLTDGNKVTKDGISNSLIYILDFHPKYLLTWLSNKEMGASSGFIKEQLDLISVDKKIDRNKVKNAILNTIYTELSSHKFF